MDSMTLLNSRPNGTRSTSHMWVETDVSILIAVRDPRQVEHTSAAAEKVRSGAAEEPEQAI